MKTDLLTDILKNQVTPALGCTEPGAVAYATARAKELLGAEVKKLNIEVDKNILKNGASVGIPGTKEHGIVFAAALSLIIGKSEYALEVLKDVDEESIAEALKIVDAGIIDLKLNPITQGLYIKAEALGDKDSATVIIRDAHTNIVFERKNDEVLLDSNNALSGEKKASNEIKYEIKKFTIDDLIDYVNRVPAEELAFIQKGIDMNMKIAKAGLREETGVGLGNYMFNKAEDVFAMAKAYTAAASEARMSGYLLPVMSSAGSGNHGLVAIIPIAYIGGEMEILSEKVLRSVALSHLITIYVKVYLGALSPVCGYTGYDDYYWEE
jgi:L-cysteine desulfidase